MLDRKKSKETAVLPGAAELLPWLFAADDRCATIATKDSMLLASWEYEGVDIESFDANALLDTEMAFDAFLRDLADQLPVVWTRVDRRRVDAYPYGQFDNEIAGGIDQYWGDHLADSKTFENRHYLSVGLPAAADALGMIESTRANMDSGMSYPRAFVRALLDKAVGARKYGFTTAEELERWLKRFDHTVMRAIDNGNIGIATRRLVAEELLGFLKSTVSANPMTPVAVNDQEYLDEYLSDSFIDNSIDDILVLDGNRKRYVAVFTLKNPPNADRMQFLSSLLGESCELTIATCWRALPRAEASKYLRQARSFDELRSMSLKKIAKNAMSQTSIASVDDTPRTVVGAVAEEMREAIKHQGAAFGWLATSVIVYADSLQDLKIACDSVQATLSKSGLVFFREREGALSGFCVGIPGQLLDPVRWHFAEASSLTNIMPMVTLGTDPAIHPFFSEGRDTPLPPNATFRTRFGTPYHFNYHMGQLGHTLLIGPSRNGKTVLQMFLESQFLKYPGSMIFNIDKDFSLKPATLLLDGNYIDLNPEKSEIRMNPMLVAGDDMGRAWLVGWLDRLMSARGDKLSDKEIVEISRAVDRMAGIPGVRLSSLASQLPDSLRNRLLPWCEGGVWGKFFDNDTDNFALSRVTSVEVGSVLNAGMHDVVSAFTDYAFFRIDRFLMGRSIDEIGPTMIYFEEAGYLLDDEIFAAKAREYLMTLAKKRAFLVMTAQSPEPFILHPKLGAAVRDNTATIIFMPNAQAGRELGEKYQRAFGVSDAHLELIANAESRRQYGVFKPQTGAFRVVEAQFPPSIVAALRSDAKSIAILDHYYDKENPQWKSKYLDTVQFA
jgi:type IV secretion system protein VirB4